MAPPDQPGHRPASDGDRRRARGVRRPERRGRHAAEAVKWPALLLLTSLSGLVLAGGAPQPEPDGYRMDDYRAPVPATVAGAEVMHIEAMRDLVARNDAVLID